MLFLTCVLCALAVAGLLAQGLVSSLGATDIPESQAPATSSVSAAPAPAPAAAPTTVTSVAIAAPTTTTSPPSPPSPPIPTTTAPARITTRVPAVTLVVAPASALPAAGQATQYGCPAALAYLAAYAAPAFVSSCPGDAGGHQARTICWTALPCQSGTIAIADPCPAAYMNEASNSWVLTGVSKAPVDPYGTCRT
jgi:hypothetical protein